MPLEVLENYKNNVAIMKINSILGQLQVNKNIYV